MQTHKNSKHLWPERGHPLVSVTPQIVNNKVLINLNRLDCSQKTKAQIPAKKYLHCSGMQKTINRCLIQVVNVLIVQITILRHGCDYKNLKIIIICVVKSKVRKEE